MADPTIPKVRKVRAGLYVATCGEETVRISAVSASPRRWVATPTSDHRAARSCDTKQAACDFAYDWLAEHA